MKDEDLLEVQNVTRYFTDVVKMESYPVIKLEDYNEIVKKLPPEELYKKE